MSNLVMLTALVLLAHVYISIGSIRLQARPGQPNLSTHQKGSVQLITSFGFDSPGGFIIYDKLFGELDWKNSLLVDVSEPSQLLKLRGNECAVVGYLTQVELGAGSEQFMKFIQTYVATIINKGEEKDSSLIVVMEGIPDARSRHLMQRIYEHIAEAKLFGRHIKVIFQNVEKAAEEDIAQARTLLLNTLNTAAKNKSNLVSLKDIHAMIQAPPLVSTEPSRVGSVKKISVSAGAAAMRDSERCQALADQWIAKLNSSLHDLFEGSMMFAGATVNATLQALNATVVAVTQEQAAVHQAELERVLKGSPVLLQATAEQCRQRMLHLLLPIHRNILQSMLQGSMESFDKRAARLSGVTKLPRLLRLLSAATNQGFALSLDKVRQDFLNMLTLNPAEGLLRSSRTSGGDSGTSGVTNKAAVVSSWKPCFDAGLERRRLQEYTKSRSSERINSLFLSGSYNPYVRDSPLPPIHLNLNYLIDPTAAKLGWEYRSLYDEHKEGPCENRADPLIFPGVAAIPFDPNSHPVPTEKGTSWVTLVRDFFTKE